MIIKEKLGLLFIEIALRVLGNQSRNQAIKRGELYSFKDQDQMIDFARRGNWKN